MRNRVAVAPGYGRHGGPAVAYRVYVGVLGGILADLPAVPDPIVRAAAVVALRNFLQVRAWAEPGRADAKDLLWQQVRQIDVDQRCSAVHLAYGRPRDLRGYRSCRAGRRLEGHVRERGDRDGYRGYAPQAALHGCPNGTGTEHVEAEVCAVVDARHDQVERLVVERLQGENRAVGGRALYGCGVDAGYGRLDRTRANDVGDGYGCADAAVVAIGRDDGDAAHWRQGRGEAPEAVGVNAVVVGYEDSHGNPAIVSAGRPGGYVWAYPAGRPVIR